MSETKGEYHCSPLEYELSFQMRAAGLPEPAREYIFNPVRKWRFDFALPVPMIAIEVEGGIWTKGRHTRGKGYEEDCYKYNEAALLGWRIFRFTPKMIRSGEAIRYIEMALAKKEG